MRLGGPEGRQAVESGEEESGLLCVVGTVRKEDKRRVRGEKVTGSQCGGWGD